MRPTAGICGGLLLLAAWTLGASSALGSDVVPGEIIVEYAPAVSTSTRTSARREAGAVRLASLGGRRELVRVPRAEATAALAELRADPRVRRAAPNITVRAQRTPNDSLYGLLWGLHNTGQTILTTTGTADADIDAPEAWDVRVGGVPVAVVDTGIEATHPDLDGTIWTNPGEIPGDGIDNDGNGYIDDVRGWDWVENENDATDDMDGHGTHVAGTIGAESDNGQGVTGVAWTTPLVPLRALGDDGSGTFASIIAAFDYAGRTGIPIVNASLGGQGNAALQAMIADVVDDWPDTLYVVAAGNDGTNLDTYTAALALPCEAASVVDNLICVAASDSRDERASFSNYGQAVTLAAPGTAIVSTYLRSVFASGYAYLSGTSMASPHVAGAAALVAAESGLRGAALRTRLEDTAEQVFTLEEVPGYRRLNLNHAVRGASPDVTPPSVPALSAPNAGTTRTTTPTLTWTPATDANGMFAHRVSVNGAPVATLGPSASTHTLSTALADRTHTLSVTAIDRSGNTRTDSVEVTVDATAPSAPTLTPSSGEFSRWQGVASVSVSASSTDAGSGVSGYHYRVGAEAWDTSGTSPSVSAEGVSSVCARAVDGAGNVSAESCAQIWLDRTAPSAPGTVALDPGADGEWQSAASVTITASGSTDAHSGVARYEFQRDGTGAWAAGSRTETDEGYYPVCARAVDAVGNASAVTCAQVRLDRTAPTPTWTDVPAASAERGADLVYAVSWDEPVTGMSAEDVIISGNASGCSASVSDATTTSATVTVRGCSAGYLTVSMSADAVTDRAGNTGPGTAVAARTVMVTDGFPALSWSVPDGPTRADPITLTLSAPVGISGLSADDLTVIGAVSGCAVSVSERDGRHLDITARDCGEGTLRLDLAADALRDELGNAGPASPLLSPPVIIDRTAPGVPAVSAAGGSGWQSVTSVAVRAEGSATTSDPTPAYESRLHDGAWTAMTPDASAGVLVVDAEGVHQVCVRSRDDAGNTSASACTELRVDRSAPTAATLGAPAPDATITPGVVRFEWEPGVDSLSGLAAQRLVVANEVIDLDARARTAEVELPAGTVRWSVDAVDAAGNVRSSQIRTLTLATTADPPAPPADPCAALTGGAATICRAAQAERAANERAAQALTQRLSACAARAPAAQADCRTLARADHRFALSQARATRTRATALVRCPSASSLCARRARATFTLTMSTAGARRTLARTLVRCDARPGCAARAQARYRAQLSTARRVYQQALSRR